MNHWTQLSVEYANQRSYLDDLYRIYPIIPSGIREVDEEVMQKVEEAYHAQNNIELIKNLLQLDLFPIKDSYVAYLREDKTAIERNPQTINRICGRLYELEFQKLYENCTEPKETNRQIGPLFRNWLRKGELGLRPVAEDQFLATQDNAILEGSDAQLKDFAARVLGYHREKGLDFIGRFNGTYVIGEAKFITAYGGHQNAQFHDAVSTLKTPINNNVVKVAIIDGVPYIANSGKLYKSLEASEDFILSALVLREFLYSL